MQLISPHITPLARGGTLYPLLAEEAVRTECSGRTAKPLFSRRETA
jgi:hypothetical protein